MKITYLYGLVNRKTEVLSDIKYFRKPIEVMAFLPMVKKFYRPVRLTSSIEFAINNKPRFFETCREVPFE